MNRIVVGVDRSPATGAAARWTAARDHKALVRRRISDTSRFKGRRRFQASLKGYLTARMIGTARGKCAQIASPQCVNRISQTSIHRERCSASLMLRASGPNPRRSAVVQASACTHTGRCAQVSSIEWAAASQLSRASEGATSSLGAYGSRLAELPSGSAGQSHPGRVRSVHDGSRGIHHVSI